MDHTFFLFIIIIGAFFFIGGIILAILAIWDDDSNACITMVSILFGSALLFLAFTEFPYSTSITYTENICVTVYGKTYIVEMGEKVLSFHYDFDTIKRKNNEKYQLKITNYNSFIGKEIAHKYLLVVPSTDNVPDHTI